MKRCTNNAKIGWSWGSETCGGSGWPADPNGSWAARSLQLRWHVKKDKDSSGLTGEKTRIHTALVMQPIDINMLGHGNLLRC